MPHHAVPSRRLVATTSLLAVLLLAGCGEPSPPTARPLAPVLVVGVDGLEWDVLHPLLAAGRCPNLMALIERGAFGRLGTMIPTSSPVLWTTIATGKEPGQHGIHGFVDRQNRPFTSTRRQGRALWNIADRYGLTCNVFGWWITWPVEPIRGVMVSATSASSMVDQNWKPALMETLPDQVHPPELERRVLDLAARAGALERLQAVAREEVFGDLQALPLGELEKGLVQQTLWSIQSDATFFALAAELLPEHPADLSLVYFGGPDVAGHRFWRHYAPGDFAYAGSSPEVDAALAGVIPRYYEWVDEMLGGLLAAAPADTTVFVVSDHGMHAIATDAPNERHTTGDHQDGAPGVVVAAGPGIARQGAVKLFLDAGPSALPTHGSVLGVAPTVLGLLGIPPSREMQARAIVTLLQPDAAARITALGVVETHDDGFRPAAVVELPAGSEQDFVERMRGLGYLDAAGADTQLDVQPQLVDPAHFEPDTKGR